jgi:Fe-S-cluster-containing dehydrogenase component
MCFDRTSLDLAPMCASVCPSQALWFGTAEEFAAERIGLLNDAFAFGRQTVRTKVHTVTREPGPVEVLARTRPRAWQDDPFGLEEDRDG